MRLERAHSHRRPQASSKRDVRHLLLVGANHRTCPLDAREVLLRKATYPRMRRAGGPRPLWEDLLLLTTCNRIEVYAVTGSPLATSEAIRNALELPRGSPALYLLEDADAAAHLFRVASGLDSLAQGEDQVTAQVRRAPTLRPHTWGQDTLLGSLFAQAARAAPRIRALAGLDAGRASASHAAIRFIDHAVPVAHPKVVLLGTGKMARIAAGGLRGRASLTLLNRDLRKAQQVGTDLGGRGERLARLEASLVRADVVLAATASRRPLVTLALVRRALAKRQGRPLWLIDLGFPRNIDARCRGLEGVTLTDIDGLAPWGLQPLPPAALARAESRIREETGRLLESLRPAGEFGVVQFRKAVEELRRQEVEHALARLPRLTEEDRAVVDKLATRLVNRFLHGPTERLRQLPEATRSQIVRELVVGLQATGGRPR